MLEVLTTKLNNGLPLSCLRCMNKLNFPDGRGRILWVDFANSRGEGGHMKVPSQFCSMYEYFLELHIEAAMLPLGMGSGVGDYSPIKRTGFGLIFFFTFKWY